EPLFSNCFARATWSPRQLADFKLDRGAQPIFKLHGSSNWRNADGKQPLVMGGAKPNEISRNPILRWYADQFDAWLCEPGARLMVIGYGFRDQHINAAIKKAIDLGLRMFIIAPEGADLAFKLNPTREPGQIIGPSA